MHTLREYHTATLLATGEVLVAGGLYGCDDQLCTDNSSAELYNPATGKWVETGAMPIDERSTSPLCLATVGCWLSAGWPGRKLWGRHPDRTVKRRPLQPDFGQVGAGAVDGHHPPGRGCHQPGQRMGTGGRKRHGRGRTIRARARCVGVERPLRRRHQGGMLRGHCHGRGVRAGAAHRVARERRARTADHPLGAGLLRRRSRHCDPGRGSHPTRDRGHLRPGAFVLHAAVPASARPGSHQLVARGHRSLVSAVAPFEVTAAS
jgi:hypothetical protein